MFVIFYLYEFDIIYYMLEKIILIIKCLTELHFCLIYFDIVYKVYI